MGIVNIEFLHEDRAKKEARFCILRRSGNQKIIEKVDEFFHPYFYVSEETNVIKSLPFMLQGYVHKIETGAVSYRGEALQKVILNPINKDTFNEIKMCFDKTFEDDVLFRWRYIIDKEIKFDDNQRIMYFDIETDRGKFANEATKPVTSICCYDSFSGKYATFVWHPTIQLPHFAAKHDENIYYFTSEKQLLNAFLDFLDVIKPDIFSGWNIWHYDCPYLINRMHLLKIDANRLSPLRKAYSIFGDRKEFFTKIYGVECLDLMKIYEKVAYYNKAPDLKLDTVGDHVLKTGKLKVDPFCWQHKDLQALIEYNRRDVEICVKLDESLGLIKYFLSLQQIVPAPLEDLFWNSKVIDCYLLHQYHNKLVFPSKRNNQKVDFEGGLVLSPEAKLYKNVCAFDFSGMYTTIFLSFNLSPELIKEKKDNEFDIQIDDVIFDTTKKGLMPTVLDELRQRRKDMTDERDKWPNKSVEYMRWDELQGTYKSILNSCFGSFGFSSFRLYSPETAKSVTFLGRTLVKELNKVVIENGFEVILSDTDSSFCKFPDDWPIEKCLVEADELEKKINSHLEIFYHTIVKNPDLKNILHVDCENFYDRLICFGVKKKYAGVQSISKKIKLDTPKLKFVGVDIVRRNTPLPVKPVLKKIFEMVLFDKTQYEINEYLNGEISKLMKMDLFDIGVPVGLGKPIVEYTTKVQHVEAFKWSNENLKLNFQTFDKARMIYVTNKTSNKKYDVTEIVIDEDTLLPEQFEFDSDRWLEKTLFARLQPLVRIKNLNLKFNQIARNQRTLLSFS